MCVTKGSQVKEKTVTQQHSLSLSLSSALLRAVSVHMALSGEGEKEWATMECLCSACQEHFSHALESQDFPQPAKNSTTVLTHSLRPTHAHASLMSGVTELLKAHRVLSINYKWDVDLKRAGGQCKKKKKPKKTQYSTLVVSYELIDGLLKVKISIVHVKVLVINFPTIRSELPNTDCGKHVFLLHDVLLRDHQCTLGKSLKFLTVLKSHFADLYLSFSFT